MRGWIVGCIVSVGLAGCMPPDAPLPPVPPPAEDLSTWTVPELVQPRTPVRPVAILPLRDRPPTKAEQVTPFTDSTPAVVPIAVGTPLDIVLEPGEDLLNVVGGDRAPQEGGQTPRWEIKKGAEGQGDTLRPHLFVTVTEPGLTIGFTLTTTRRTYYVTCKSVGASPIRVLRWTYGQGHPPLPRQEPGKPLAVFPDQDAPARYHTGYRVESSGRPPDWLPRQVLDDGKKVYILYPEVSLFGVIPLVRMIGPNGPQLVNTRQLLNVVIVDQLAARLELRVGLGEQAETVTITRDSLRTISCPGDGDCPQWPQAAATLHGGGE